MRKKGGNFEKVTVQKAEGSDKNKFSVAFYANSNKAPFRRITVYKKFSFPDSKKFQGVFVVRVDSSWVEDHELVESHKLNILKKRIRKAITQIERSEGRHMIIKFCSSLKDRTTKLKDNH